MFNTVPWLHENSRFIAATRMKSSRLFLAALTSLLSGCVWRSGCQVVQTESHQLVTLKFDVYGAIPTMCGLTPHSTSETILKASGPGPCYSGRDISEDQRAHSKPLGGTMIIDHARNSVNVNLTYSTGQPYSMNGNYRITTTK